MLGIKIHYGALQNTLITPQGVSFDLSDKETRELVSKSTIEFLGQNGYFKTKKKK